MQTVYTSPGHFPDAHVTDSSPSAAGSGTAGVSIPTSNFHQIIQESKGPIALFKGADLIIEEANEAALALLQAGPEVIGKPFLEALPAMADREFTTRLRQVLRTGMAHSGYEVPLTSDRIAGHDEPRY